METIIIFVIISLFVIPLLLLIWSWKALLTYVLIIGCFLIWFWINYFYEISQPDYVSSSPGSGLTYVLMWGLTFLFVLGIALSILSVVLYRIIRFRR